MKALKSIRCLLPLDFIHDSHTNLLEGGAQQTGMEVVLESVNASDVGSRV